MIKLKTIADLLGWKTDDLTTEFDDSKDIFFKTIDDEFIEILKIDDERSIIFNGDFRGSGYDESIELKNNKLDGRHISWCEWIDYQEFKDGVLHGYSEYSFQEILGERGFYRNGLKDGWWEFGDKYHDCLFYENREDFHSLENYRPASLSFYINDIIINSYHTLDSEYEYQEALEDELRLSTTYMSFKEQEYFCNKYREDTLKRMRDAIESGETYRGLYTDYISYETYLKITNLPKFKPPSELADFMYSWCATSIDYDQILKEYDVFRAKKKVSEDSFKIDSVAMWRD